MDNTSVEPTLNSNLQIVFPVQNKDQSVYNPGLHLARFPATTISPQH